MSTEIDTPIISEPINDVNCKKFSLIPDHYFQPIVLGAIGAICIWLVVLSIPAKKVEEINENLKELEVDIADNTKNDEKMNQAYLSSMWEKQLASHYYATSKEEMLDNDILYQLGNNYLYEHHGKLKLAKQLDDIPDNAYVLVAKLI